MRTRFALSFAFLLLATTWLALTDPARGQTVVAEPGPAGHAADVSISSHILQPPSPVV